MTTGFRTVFLATEPTWEGWLNALERNWVVAIRHDAVSGFKTWMHGGSHEVLNFVERHKAEWQWWDNPGIQRPMVSIVAVRPEDEFEVARPVRGVTIRVRCAWENTTQGRPRKPLAELLTLVLDGTEVTPKLLVHGQPRAAALTDHYHEFHVANPIAGVHTAKTTVRVIETKTVIERTIQFSV